MKRSNKAMITCKEIETRMYPDRDKERMGSRNIVADMLHEVARAIGFNMDLLKEDFNKNKAFQFLETDYEEIKEFMEAIKSPEGKKLRCKDYKGASGYFIDQVMEFFLMLAEHNGVEQDVLREQWIKMCVQTECETVRYYIREMTDEFEEDIEKHYFVTPYTAEDALTDDYIPGTAKLVFLQFILGNIDADMSDIRGTYWFFKMTYVEKRYKDLYEAGKYLRSLSPEQLEQYKKDIYYHLEYDKVLEEDDDLAQMTDEWLKIEDGLGKLQDIKKQKKNLEMILARRNLHAENIFKCMNNQVKMPAYKQEERVSLSEQFDLAYDYVFESLREYKSYRAYRQKVPMTEDNEMMMEIKFRQRFGTALFPKEDEQ